MHLLFLFGDHLEDQQFADIMHQAGWKDLVLEDAEVEAIGQHAGGKGASHGMLPEFFHNGINLTITGAESSLAYGCQDDSRDFSEAQTGECRTDGGGDHQTPIQGGIGDFEQIAGQGLIAADQLFNGAKIGLFLDQLLLNSYGNRVKNRQGEPLWFDKAF